MSAEPYELLDSGGERRLERLGPWTIVRTAPHAYWRPRLAEDEWRRADATHHRLTTGGGRWEFHRRLPESWPVSCGGRTFRMQLTDFGHIGLFAEQLETWRFLQRTLEAAGGSPRVLNLFAYTGGSTLAAAAGGAEVVHVDASKGVVDWARENAALSGLAERPVRWLVDDVVKFVDRELRRGRRYDAVVLDPPSYGRGTRGEVWKIEEHLADLLARLRSLLSDRPLLVAFSCHSPGFTPRVVERVLADHFADLFERRESGEMTIVQGGSDAPFPTGVYGRLWTCPGLSTTRNTS